MRRILALLNDFVSLFYPELCAACGTNLVSNEKSLCTSCLYSLPYTRFHDDKQNKLAIQFYGRIPFENASAFLYFTQGSKVQSLIHQLKYRGNQAVGIKVGELFGHDLRGSGAFRDIDLVIPVPLHPAKMRKRGYNQSECIATGLSESLGVPIDTRSLFRTTNTSTQTKKSRFVRFENMQNAFGVRHPEKLAGQHLLLVDDVMTTGATIESCALQLLQIPDVRISIATVAVAV